MQEPAAARPLTVDGVSKQIIISRVVGESRRHCKGQVEINDCDKRIVKNLSIANGERSNVFKM